MTAWLCLLLLLLCLLQEVVSTSLFGTFPEGKSHIRKEVHSHTIRSIVTENKNMNQKAAKERVEEDLHGKHLRPF